MINLVTKPIDGSESLNMDNLTLGQKNYQIKLKENGVEYPVRTTIYVGQKLSPYNVNVNLNS